MHKFLVTAAILITSRSASGIKNLPRDVGGLSAPTGETSIALTGGSSVLDENVPAEYGDKYIPGSNRDDRISRPDRNFIITHEGILNYQPVSRSLHNLDQDYKASSTFTRSEVIPVSHAPSGRALSDNSLSVSAGLTNRDAQAAYTSRDALSVPLHVGFQVEDSAPPGSTVGNLRMNPKGKVLSLEGDLNGAANTRRRQPYAGQPPSPLTPQSYQMHDMSLAETSHVPSLVYGQKVESSADSAPRSTKLTSLYHQPSSHQMDLAHAASHQMDVAHVASNHYYRAIQPNQDLLNPHFTRSNDLEIAASDPRAAFEVYQNGFDSQSGSVASQHQKLPKDQSLDETKYYGDVNGGGAKSYMDYMTDGHLESKKYLGGKYGDLEDVGSEGNVPIHFGFQVEHPRLQYPPKSSFADKYHSDHHIPTHHVPTKTGKIRIPKVPKAHKYVAPSVEDLDEEIDSDFKHIKIKKYSTNNEELSIPSNYHARYVDDIPNQSRHNFKYTSSVSSPDTQQSSELLRSASTNDRQQFVPTQLSQIQRTNVHQHTGHVSQHIGQQVGQASQMYYQYVKPQHMARGVVSRMYNV